jgi:Protein of unknown function (DUF2474)
MARTSLAKRLLWFIGLWTISVAAVAVAASLIRLFIGT